MQTAEAEQGGLNRMRDEPDVVSFEQRSGLRVPGDAAPDLERKKQARS